MINTDPSGAYSTLQKAALQVACNIWHDVTSICRQELTDLAHHTDSTKMHQASSHCCSHTLHEQNADCMSPKGLQHLHITAVKHCLSWMLTAVWPLQAAAAAAAAASGSSKPTASSVAGAPLTTPPPPGACLITDMQIRTMTTLPLNDNLAMLFESAKDVAPMILLICQDTSPRALTFAQIVHIVAHMVLGILRSGVHV